MIDLLLIWRNCREGKQLEFEDFKTIFGVVVDVEVGILVVDEELSCHHDICSVQLERMFNYETQAMETLSTTSCPKTCLGMKIMKW